MENRHYWSIDTNPNFAANFQALTNLPRMFSNLAFQTPITLYSEVLHKGELISSEQDSQYTVVQFRFALELEI